MKFKFNKDIYDFNLASCESGSEVAYEFSESIDENGLPCLVSEEYNLQEVINSYADGCSIERIIIAHGLGDELVMNKKPGVYLDEDQVNIIMNGQSSSLELNAQLFSLYQGYKDYMTFEQFSNYVAHGDFKALDDAKKPKEEAQ